MCIVDVKTRGGNVQQHTQTMKLKKAECEEKAKEAKIEPFKF